MTIHPHSSGSVCPVALDSWARRSLHWPGQGRGQAPWCPRTKSRPPPATIRSSVLPVDFFRGHRYIHINAEWSKSRAMVIFLVHIKLTCSAFAMTSNVQNASFQVGIYLHLFIVKRQVETKEGQAVTIARIGKTDKLLYTSLEQLGNWKKNIN